jgi:3-methyl-2-oxobutanoate hydroxymethyltransferase
VLEGIPRDLAAQVTSALTIPTIGIGAGPDCDAQVLIIYDLLGITPHVRGAAPKFARAYADIGDRVVTAARAYADDVRDGRFPDDAHSYH